MGKYRKSVFSLIGAAALCGLLLCYAAMSDDYPILPIKIITAPAFIVGALLSGNVHQPSAIGAWSVFLLYAWGLTYGMWTIVEKLMSRRHRSDLSKKA